MPPLCRDQQHHCCDHDTVTDQRLTAANDEQYLPSRKVINPVPWGPQSFYDYPSHLNASALKFGSCWTEADETNILRGCCKRGGLPNLTSTCAIQADNIGGKYHMSAMLNNMSSSRSSFSCR